jgi:1-acyl-sn-glycerol-3-phosphate acyltransferase
VSPTWQSEVGPPVSAPIGPICAVRAALRGTVLATVTYGCLALLLAVRLFEWPFGRPVSPSITRFVCICAVHILGFRYRVRGRPMRGGGVIAANHVSWLDIFALNAAGRLVFVAKSEVRGWPGIGILARATGVLFVDRDRARAAEQTRAFRDRLAGGETLLLFPEGTSTDGLRVLPFKPTLFAALYGPGAPAEGRVQPVTLVYRAPPGADPRLHGWWGDMSFAANLLQVLARRRQGSVEVVFHPPLKAADFPDRKALAGAVEASVRAGLDAAGLGNPSGAG